MSRGPTASSQETLTIGQSPPSAVESVPNISLISSLSQFHEEMSHRSPMHSQPSSARLPASSPQPQEIDLEAGWGFEPGVEISALSSGNSLWHIAAPLLLPVKKTQLFSPGSSFDRSAQSITACCEEINMIEPDKWGSVNKGAFGQPKRSSDLMWGTNTPTVYLHPTISAASPCEETEEATMEEQSINDLPFGSVIFSNQALLYNHHTAAHVRGNYGETSLSKLESSAGPPDFIGDSSMETASSPYGFSDTIQLSITCSQLLSPQSCYQRPQYNQSSVQSNQEYQLRDPDEYDGDSDEENAYNEDKPEEAEIPYKHPIPVDEIVEDLLALSITEAPIEEQEKEISNLRSSPKRTKSTEPSCSKESQEAQVDRSGVFNTETSKPEESSSKSINDTPRSGGSIFPCTDQDLPDSFLKDEVAIPGMGPPPCKGGDQMWHMDVVEWLNSFDYSELNDLAQTLSPALIDFEFFPASTTSP
ncbi:uncharacterized protein I206_101158 [Kwoniella pini CBS 10737]|uniref:Uncharacterized protein n=1 Tax=Kwoniella pini CBS 10737 TaxID=1296096 RepID=A0A1B9IB49_9TREE|nr:uncharacterized protein I206_00168 [Kwoniella pini CBS 10737]OCF52868.1 hypothetical protein I206_00168 [Kwoniella pini CBS 10737]